MHCEPTWPSSASLPRRDATDSRSLVAIITDKSKHEALPSAMKQALQAIVDQLAALELQIGGSGSRHPRASSSQRDEPAPRNRTRDRRDRCHGDCCHCHRPEWLQIRAGFRSMDRTRAAAALDAVARSGLAASPSKEIAICDGCSSSVQQPSFGTPGCIPKSIPGSCRLLAKKPAKVVAVAVANKMARIAWAIMAKGETYRAPALAAAA